jgi:hypothetical protein
MVLVPSGIYVVTVQATGFAKAEIANVSVKVGQVSDINVTIGVGAVSEAITVTADAIQTTVSQPDALINEASIANLPINGRRFQDFVTLTPTAQVDPQRGQISLSGQRGINSNINVDGMDYNQPFFGGIRGGERSNTAFTIPQESVEGVPGDCGRLLGRVWPFDRRGGDGGDQVGHQPDARDRFLPAASAEHLQEEQLLPGA